MEMDLFLNEKPYSLPAEEKTRRYLKALTRLTDYHRERCRSYGRFVRSMGFLGCPGDSPFLCGKNTTSDGEGMDCRTQKMRMPAAGSSLVPAEEAGKECGKSARMCLSADSTGQKCPEPGSTFLQQALAALPFLPVSTFKEMDLLSVPEEEIYKTMTSSGTSGQKVSKIFLDVETSMRQQQVLSRIVTDFIGDSRLPFLILDCPRVLKDRAMFSARGAGILGFSIFGKDRCFALDEKMEPDFEAVETFLQKHAGEKILVFGFTYILWKQFICRLEQQGRTLSIPEGILIHGGGWKKLADEAVSKEELKARILRATGIRHVHEYYGMAEQTGCIYMECECGHLHTSNWSDILIRRPEDYSLCNRGEPGILQVMTPIAHSYPGHNLLTEDLGILLGEDDCPCSRMGKYFSVIGRIPKAEVRGCSDTFEGLAQTAGIISGTDTDDEKAEIPGDNDSASAVPAANPFHIGAAAELLAGTRDPRRTVNEVFSPEAMDFISALSRAVLHDPQARSFPEIAAFGFWCRRAHLETFKKRHAYLSPARLEQKVPGDHTGAARMSDEEEESGSFTERAGTSMTGGRSLGRGMAFHMTPANVPAMFAYSFVISLLAGNSSIVRVSARTGQIGDILCRLIRETLDVPPFSSIQESTAFIRYDRDAALTQRLMENADVRVVWGGDETVRKMHQLPAKAGAVDVLFPDRWSLAMVSLRALSQMTDEELSVKARYFYNDTYIMDQRGCSSPQLVVFLDDFEDPDSGKRESYDLQADDIKPDTLKQENVNPDFLRPYNPQAEKDRFWKAVAEISKKEYEWDAYKSARKYEKLSLFLLRNGNENTAVRRYGGNLVQIIDLGALPSGKKEYSGGFGLFFEARIRTPEELLPMLTPKVQTLSCIGMDRRVFSEFLFRNHADGIDRVIPAGEALQMDTVWDGRDLIAQMSRHIECDS